MTNQQLLKFQRVGIHIGGVGIVFTFLFALQAAYKGSMGIAFFDLFLVWMNIKSMESMIKGEKETMERIKNGRP